MTGIEMFDLRFNNTFRSILFQLVHRTYKRECYAYLYGSADHTSTVWDAEEMMLMGPLPGEL